MRKRINETMLNSIVKESVKKVLRENPDDYHDYQLGLKKYSELSDNSKKLTLEDIIETELRRAKEAILSRLQ